jgi:hypothetical protein
MGYWWESSKERDVDGMIILEWISEKWRDMYWIDMAQDTYHWMALVNVVMNRQIP